MSCVARSSAISLLLTTHVIFTHVNMALGGICWSAMRGGSGRCTELLLETSSREQCCSSYGGVATAWSPEPLDSGALFFWRVLGGGVPCTACKESCLGVQCGPEKRCQMRSGRPKCVCAPKCGIQQHYQHLGQDAMRSVNTLSSGSRSLAMLSVCGTDGRSYRNLCRLKKRACRRRRSANLAVAYYGTCQTSCHSITCPSGKHCLLDQNLRPHCVRCTHKCSTTNAVNQTARRKVCGSDGVTYQSVCHLREAACRRGKAIPLAYRGACKPTASCSTVRCHNKQTCLRDRTSPLKTTARCVSCHLRICSVTANAINTDLNDNAVSVHGSGENGRKRAMSLAVPNRSGDEDAHTSPRGLLCASNNHTYTSWCHMMQDACAIGEVIETRHAGQCAQQNILVEHF